MTVAWAHFGTLLPLAIAHEMTPESDFGLSLVTKA